MSAYECNECKDTGVVSYPYQHCHMADEVTMYEKCRCNTNPPDKEFWKAQGVCDNLSIDGTPQQFHDYVNTLHPKVKKSMLSMYSIKPVNN